MNASESMTGADTPTVETCSQDLIDRVLPVYDLAITEHLDAAWPKRGKLIKAAAESLFGNGTRPASMLLTHIHPDHSGSARDLACICDLPLYVHPRELPLVPGEYRRSTATRWTGGSSLMGVLPKRTVGSMVSEASLTGVARPFDPAEPAPGLPACPPGTLACLGATMVPAGWKPYRGIVPKARRRDARTIRNRYEPVSTRVVNRL